MFFCTALSLVIGLYFARYNLVVSILISIAYFVFVLWKYGKKKVVVFIAFFAIGVFIPRVTFASNNGPDYGGIVIDARDNYYIFQSKFERYYVYSKGNDFEIGDQLVIEGGVKEIKQNTFESQFNFKSYLFNRGVGKELVVKKAVINRRSALKLNQFKKKFLAHYDENTATLISAFLFNDKDYSSDLVKRADSNNVLFLFSLSGVYLHALFAIANYLLLLRFTKKTSRILTFTIFIPFAIFSFTKIGTLRVFGLYILKTINEFFLKRKRSHVELVSLLALIFLTIDYHLVYQEAFYIGFLLSIIAPVALSALKFLKKWKQKVASTLLFYGFTFPLRVRSSYLCPLTFVEMLMFIPLNFLFLVSSMLSVVIPIYKPTILIGKAIIWVLEGMDAINLRIPFGNWGGAFIYLYLTVFLLLVFYLESVRIKHAKIAIACLAVMITISVVPLQEPISNCVYFVNVGQGDSIIIKNKIYTVMIDTGGYKSFDMAEETLIPFMNKKKITHIDALILSHDDFDHAGAKDSLIEKFKVYEVLTEPEQFPYQIGDLKFENLNDFGFEEENDKSLVLSLNFIGKKFLFTGDASVNTEEKMIEKYDVDCDILKVGHHGSNTSTSEKFLKLATPEEAVISCGEKNYYGHPQQEIVDRLKKYNVKIRRTDQEGTICYFSLTA